MRIGIDIDDTISDTYEVLFNYAQKYTIEELNKNGNVNADVCLSHHYIEAINDWNEKEAKKFWDKYYVEVLNKLKPKTLAPEYIRKLAENNEIILISARWTNENRGVLESTLEFLKKYNIPYNKIVLDAEDKLKIAKENNLDVLIDDSFENCLQVSEIGTKAYLMDTFINRKVDLKGTNIKRVYSWVQAYQELNK